MPDILLQLQSGGRLKDYIRAFEVAERSGFNGVEIDTRSLGPDYDRFYLLSLEHGLPIRSLMAQSPVSFYLFDDASDQEAIQEIKPDVVAFKTPRAPFLRWPVEKIFTDQVGKYIENFGKSRIGVENAYERYSGILKPLFNVKGLRDFIYEHDVSAIFDVSDCAASGMDILLSLDMLMPRIKNIHFSDYGGQSSRGHRFPGFGLLPLGTLLSRLKEYRYNGLITLEVDPGELPIDDGEHVTLFGEIIRFIKSYF